MNKLVIFTALSIFLSENISAMENLTSALVNALDILQRQLQKVSNEPPPVPTGPGPFIPGLVTPVSIKPLSAQQVAALVRSEKDKSDQYLLKKIREMATPKKSASSDMVETLKNSLNSLKSQGAYKAGFRFTENFDQIVDQIMKQINNLVQRPFNENFVNREIAAAQLARSFEQLFFYPQPDLVSKMARDIMINIIAAQRIPELKVGGQGTSDELFLGIFSTSDSISQLKDKLNMLRINPDYLKYKSLEDDLAKTSLARAFINPPTGSSPQAALMAELLARVVSREGTEKKAELSIFTLLDEFFLEDLKKEEIDKVVKQFVSHDNGKRYLFDPDILITIENKLKNLIAQEKERMTLAGGQRKTKSSRTSYSLDYFIAHGIDDFNHVQDLRKVLIQLGKGRNLLSLKTEAGRKTITIDISQIKNDLAVLSTLNNDEFIAALKNVDGIKNNPEALLKLDDLVQRDKAIESFKQIFFAVILTAESEEELLSNVELMRQQNIPDSLKEMLEVFKELRNDPEKSKEESMRIFDKFIQEFPVNQQTQIKNALGKKLYPYGHLIQLVKYGATVNPEERNEKLKALVQELNAGKDLSISPLAADLPKELKSALQEYYKGSLISLIAALEQHNIREFFKQLGIFAHENKSKKFKEEIDRFKKETASYYIQGSMSMYSTLLSSLNAGRGSKKIIPSLPTQYGSPLYRRNIIVYEALEGVFTPMIMLLTTLGNKTHWDQADYNALMTQWEAVKKTIMQRLDASIQDKTDRDAIFPLITDFLSGLDKQFEQLGQQII